MSQILRLKSLKIILITFLIYGGLVATHEGEFWPLSIYPMFSQGANPWTRALVRDVRQEDIDKFSQVTSIRELPGEPVPLGAHGIDTIDFSNFVSKTEEWTAERKQALRTMFGEDMIAEHDLLVMKANGIIQPDNEIIIEVVPFILFTPEGNFKLTDHQ